MQATLLDKLRLIAWPSASTLDLVRNNANLRDLNVWYRNWSGAIRHKVFYEKQGTTAGVIVGDDSSDPGLLHVDPVGIDADHLDICKPADVSDLVYIRTRDFIADEIIPDVGSSAGYGDVSGFRSAQIAAFTIEQVRTHRAAVGDYLDRGLTLLQRDRGSLLPTGCSGQSKR